MANNFVELEKKLSSRFSYFYLFSFRIVCVGSWHKDTTSQNLKYLEILKHRFTLCEKAYLSGNFRRGGDSGKKAVVVSLFCLCLSMHLTKRYSRHSVSFLIFFMFSFLFFSLYSCLFHHPSIFATV